MTKLYTTLQEAIECEVIPSLDNPNDFDLVGIADKVFKYVVPRDDKGNHLIAQAGFRLIVDDVDEFSDILLRNSRIRLTMTNSDVDALKSLWGFAKRDMDDESERMAGNPSEYTDEDRKTFLAKVEATTQLFARLTAQIKEQS